MDFELESKFKPLGDQPEAIKKLTDNFLGGVKHQTLWGVTGSGKTFTIANLVKNVQKPTLVIAHNKTLAAQLADEFRDFFPQNSVQYFVSYYDYYQPEAYIPQTDTYIEKDSSINDEIDRLRHAATHALLTRKDVLIVASVSCIYGIGSPDLYISKNFQFNVGDTYKREQFLNALNKMQYQRNDTELKRGTFSLRGDTLEIFPAYEANTVRVKFFGDSVEEIEAVDWVTGKKIATHKSYELFPAKHFLMPESKMADIVANIRSDLVSRVNQFKKEGKLLEAQRLQERTNYDLEMIELTGYCSGIENYSRYFDGRKPGEPTTTLIDYFPDDFLTVIDESHMTIPQINGMYAGDRSRKQKLIDYGFRLPSAFDNRPLKFDEFYQKVNKVVFTSATPSEFEINKSSKDNALVVSKSAESDERSHGISHFVRNDRSVPYDAVIRQFIRPTGLLDPQVEIRQSAGQIDNLIAEIESRVKKGERVLVTTLTKKMAEALTEYLAEKKIKVAYLHSDVETLERSKILHSLRLGEYDVLVGINLLREGLDLPEVSLVAILDADKEGFLRSKTSLIQNFGRAARHLHGKVILYADNMTKSIKEAIRETDKRRAVQEKYNADFNITPRGIEKNIKPKEEKEEEKLLAIDLSFKKLPKSEKKKVINDLAHEMRIASGRLQFERAAELRDQISLLENLV